MFAFIHFNKQHIRVIVNALAIHGGSLNHVFPTFRWAMSL